MESVSAILITFLVLTSLSLACCKHFHGVPTYFGRLNAIGKLLDVNSPEFNANIKTPLINHISHYDSSSSLKVIPNVVENGATVDIFWSNIKKPQEQDFVAFYCPAVDNSSRYLDFFYVTDSPTWNEGYGHYCAKIYNMRTTCVFKYYKSQESNSQLVAVSNIVSFKDGGSLAPLHGHIAMTTNPTEMRVMWTSGEVQNPAVVKYGLTKNLLESEYEVVVRTYTADSMCRAPANSTGFWHPGYIYDVLLQNLKPNTRYYYSYGTEDQMSQIMNFTTPLPKGSHAPYKFIVYGDLGLSPFPQADATADFVSKEVFGGNYRFVFHLGDTSYACGHSYIWEQWFKSIESYATLVPYMVGIGNHEYDHTTGGEKDPSHSPGEGGFRRAWFNGGDDSGGECGVPMLKHFHMPESGNSLWWYSYDYGLVHYIMMSTEHDYSPGSPQYKWLEHDLMNVDRLLTPWVIIGGHRAMYCSQLLADEYIVAVNMQRLLEDLLYKYKVDLALWAHYHAYERTCKLYKNRCIHDGITHIIVGSAGKDIDGSYWFDREWSVFHVDDYGYGRVTVANSSALLYEWVQNRYNKVVDHVWLTK